VCIFSSILAFKAVSKGACCTHLGQIYCFDITFYVTLCAVKGSNAYLQMIYKYLLLNGFMKCCALGYCAYIYIYATICRLCDRG